MLPAPSSPSQRLFFASHNAWWVVALLALVVTGLYGHTLHAPWYFDDHSVILENPQVQDLGLASKGLPGPRGVALFSFAVNYAFAGEQILGYHLTNLVIHLLCAYLVYGLLRRGLSSASWALSGALLFAAHPLQTQAVTYVVQRMTSLAALFFLLSLELFLRFREELVLADPGRPLRARALYAGALLAGILAVFTKENAAVLPLALILFVRCFDREDRRWRPLLVSVAPFLLAPLALAASTFAPLLSGDTGLTSITGIAGSEATPWRYLVTQFSAIWLYLRLLVLPYGQALDYGYPLANSLWNLQSLLALAGLLALGGWGWMTRHRLPAVAFGIGWFFLTLAVESRLIPLDPVFEHRLYLPMLGFAAAVLGLAETVPRQRLVAGTLLLVVALYGVLTWQRNELWNDPLAFSADNVKKRPDNDRAFFNLAVRTINSGNRGEGVALLQQALQRFPHSCPAYLTLADMAKAGGRLDEGVAILQQAAANCTDKALAYNNLGFFYGLKRQPDKLLESLTMAMAADPGYADSDFNLVRFLIAENRLTEAEEYLRRGLQRSRRNAAAYVDLGKLLERQGRRQEALNAFRATLKLAPNNAAAVAGVAANRR